MRDSAPDTTPQHILHCPSCSASFVLEQSDLAGRWLCVACQGLVSGDPAQPLRWLYPITGPAPLPGLEDRSNTPQPTAATATGEGAEEDVPPNRVIDRYVIDGELGAGGMGVVYRAWDPQLERMVALKMLTAGRFASAQAQARFIGEARIAAALTHPAIVRVYDMGAVERRTFFTMEEVRGPSLQTTLRAYGPLMTSEVARIAEILADAVQHAHTASVAHRDLKPANVLLTCSGYPRITDFGLAKPLGIERDLTATQNMLGTPAYMAPEVARGERDIDWMLVDLYGLGAILYAMLTGSPPSRGATMANLIASAGRGERASIRSLRPGMPAALEAIADRALHHEPSRRYQSAGELAADLRRFQAGEAVLARPEGPVIRTGRWLRRNRWRLGVSVGGALVLAGALAVPGIRAHREAMVRERAAAEAWRDTEVRVRQAASDGRHDEVDAVISDFVDAEPYEGTAAAAEALLAWGDLTPPRPAPWNEQPDTRPLDRWSLALLETPDDALRAQVLLRIAQWQNDNTQFEQMAPLLDSLERFGGPAIESDSLPLRLQWALATGRLEEANTAWDRAKTLGLPIADQVEDPRRIYNRFGHGQRLVEPLDWPHPLYVATLKGTGEPAMVLHSKPPRVYGLRPVRLLEGTPESLVVPPLDLWLADLDEDGIEERYSSSYRKGLARTIDGVREQLGPQVGVPTTPDIHGTRLAEIDGEAPMELLVSGGEWQTYDLRILQSDGAGGLKLRARTHRNAVMGALPISDPWRPGTSLIATLEDDKYSNVTVFGEDNPSGPPRGVVFWQLEGETLREVHSWLNGRSAYVTSGFTADLDGDGQEELVLARSGRRIQTTVVFRLGAAPDTFIRSEFFGMAPRVAVDVDGDGAMELIVAEVTPEGTALWLLGAGDTARPLPAQALPRDVEPVPEALVGTPGEAVWESLQALQRAGLMPQAAAVLERFAEVSEASVRTAASAHAAALWAEVERPEAAARMWERAAQGQDPEANAHWAEAVEAWLQAAAPEEAIAAAARWRVADGRGPTGALLARLQAWEESLSKTVSLAGGVHPALQIEEPLALSVSTEGLRVDAVSGLSSIAQIPLHWAGGPLSIEAEMTLHWLEWGSNIAFGLVPPDDLDREHIHLGAEVNGGGGVNRLRARCLKLGWDYVLEAPPRTTYGEPVRVRYRISWSEDDGWRCLLSLPDEGTSSLSVDRSLPPPEPDMLLRLHTFGLPGLSQRMGAVLHQLDVRGVEAGPPSDAPRHRFAAALLNNTPQQALALSSSDTPLSQALALVQLGRLSESIEALRVAQSRGQLSSRGRLLLRSHRETWAPLLRDALGADFVPFVDEATQAAPLEAAWVRESLIRDLSGLELFTASPGLAARRAIALLKEGRQAQGRAAIEDWLERWAALESEAADALRNDASQLLRLMSVDAAQAGDADAARAYALRCFEAAWWPELEHDRLAASTGWKTLGATLPPVP